MGRVLANDCDKIPSEDHDLDYHEWEDERQEAAPVTDQCALDTPRVRTAETKTLSTNQGRPTDQGSQSRLFNRGRPVKSCRPTRTAQAGSRTARTFEFGRTHVVRPKGKHQATIVWLHGLGDNGSSSSQLLDSLPLPNIKWICPTAPTRPVTLLGGFPCTAWFDAGELSEDGSDDWEALDASAAHIANLLSTEPADVKVGIGGFSMGAAMALYSATCYAQGRYGNGIPYPVHLRAIVGLSGWLPGARTLRSKIQSSHEAARRAASLPILLCHGICDDVVLYKYGEKSAHALSSAGFRSLTFKPYEGLGHYTVPGEMDEICHWLTPKLGLEGSRPTRN
ncbi:hypothetical protein CJ030_MR3G026529 [Morella rubra]|uniref:Phospholipase/carboxylesterase/thioesterase domain-containing protein n=1 Tax=Morella rubra TaxID=262757 RepID=A0A6A1W080_9ROSI|nr:hypothetical protein CJ030_MR3G026529 [Morella rubra]